MKDRGVDANSARLSKSNSARASGIGARPLSGLVRAWFALWSGEGDIYKSIMQAYTPGCLLLLWATLVLYEMFVVHWALQFGLPSGTWRIAETFWDRCPRRFCLRVNSSA